MYVTSHTANEWVLPPTVHTYFHKNAIIGDDRQLRGMFEIEIIYYYTKGNHEPAGLRMERQRLIDLSVHANAQHGKPLLNGSSQNASTLVKTFLLQIYTQLSRRKHLHLDVSCFD